MFYPLNTRAYKRVILNMQFNITGRYDAAFFISADTRRCSENTFIVVKQPVHAGNY